MKPNLTARLTTSLEKPFPSAKPEDYPALTSLSVLKGERFNLQLLLRPETEEFWGHRIFTVEVQGIDATVRAVKNIFVDHPHYGVDKTVGTAKYLAAPDGLYPDVLEPVIEGKYVNLRERTLSSFWIEATSEKAGVTELHVIVKEEGKEGVAADLPLTLTVVNKELPDQTLIFTQWFHCDCLASYYNVDVFSEEHWRIIENYMAMAARHGISCILTPVLTPPLDTWPGTYRTTVQLVGITKTGEDYAFDFSLLKRYIDLARSCGIRYFEISHLFSQWGAACAPKVVATVDGEEKRIFGWDTPSTEGEYPRFLSFFLPALVDFLRTEGVLPNCRFHISDEPSEEHLPTYRKGREIVAPYLKDCILMDALGSVELFRDGTVPCPIPSNDHIEPFLSEDIPERWTYTCCGQMDEVSNRFIAYPSYRNRILGVQMYKFGIDGFLQWGYNFYYDCGSRHLVNPYLSQSGNGWVQSGDPFSVYPAPAGEPLASLRLAVFHEAIQDREALKLCESLVGREKVIALIDELAGEPITFKQYPTTPDYILTLRERVNALIAEAL